MPMPQIRQIFVVPPTTEEIMKVIQPGTRLLTCSLVCNDKCLGRQQKTVEVPQLLLSCGRPVLGQGVCMPGGV